MTNLIRYAKPGERTMLDLIRDYFPGCTEEEADWILWEKTCYPFGDVRPNLEKLKRECKL